MFDFAFVISCKNIFSIGAFSVVRMLKPQIFKKVLRYSSQSHAPSNISPYIVRMSYNNGQKGFINEDEQYLNEGNTISFGQDTATMYYQEKPYFTGDKIKILKSRCKQFNKSNAQFFSCLNEKFFCKFFMGKFQF